MNNPQIVNLFTVLVTTLCGYFVSQGKIDNDSAMKIGGGIVALLTLVIAHCYHGTTPSSNAGTGAGRSKLSLLLALALPALMFTGCTTTPQQASYQAAGSVSVTVEGALTAYNAFAAAGKTTPAQNAAVKAAYEKYQAAFAVVCDAGAIYAASATTNAPAASAALQQAVANASQSINDLTTLIQSLGVKL